MKLHYQDCPVNMTQYNEKEQIKNAYFIQGIAKIMIK